MQASLAPQELLLNIQRTTIQSPQFFDPWCSGRGVCSWQSCLTWMALPGGCPPGTGPRCQEQGRGSTSRSSWCLCKENIMSLLQQSHTLDLHRGQPGSTVSQQHFPIMQFGTVLPVWSFWSHLVVRVGKRAYGNLWEPEEPNSTPPSSKETLVSTQLSRALHWDLGLTLGKKVPELTTEAYSLGLMP